jgi:putative transposase
MKKLKPWQIIDIVSKRLLGKSAYNLAKKHKITPRWVRYLTTKYMQTGQMPHHLPCGRPAKPITTEELQIISNAYNKYGLKAVRLEDCLSEFMDIDISHNRIHKILRKLKISKRSYKKSHRRKWIRYERYKSNSLWHADWTKIGKNYLIVFIDDASRFIVGWGIFAHATTENSILVLERAIATYGNPKAILTGHDTQFCSNKNSRIKTPDPNRFQIFLKKNKIKHIFARVNHPQTNGKCERVFGTIKAKIKEKFDTLEGIFHWYNNVRPHMSLKDGLQTPSEAYVQKMRNKKKIAVDMVIR